MADSIGCVVGTLWGEARVEVWSGLREGPAAEDPGVAMVVRGLNVTVLCGRGGGVAPEE